MRRSRYQTCKATGKRCFTTEDDVERALDTAKARAKRMRFKGQERRRREKRYYECDACAGWHLTSQPLRQKV